MKTIICGAGEVGKSIAEKLSKEDFEVTVIDESKERLKKISESLDVKTIQGTSSLPTILSTAGAQECDILIAVTKSDETNMISCQIGYSLFNIPTKIARQVRDTIFIIPDLKERNKFLELVMRKHDQTFDGELFSEKI